MRRFERLRVAFGNRVIAVAVTHEELRRREAVREGAYVRLGGDLFRVWREDEARAILWVY